jgi:hypothetical protein
VPYGADTVPAKKFNYKEDVSGGNSQFLWGNAAFAFASRLTESFADYRWCANVIGPQGGGTVNDLPIYTYESMGELQNKIPTEVLISERREFELAEQGFIALTMRKNSDNAAFFSANSAQKPKFFGNSKEGKEAELNYKLSTQLPYMFVVSRLARGSRKRTQYLDTPIRRRYGQPRRRCAQPPSTAPGRDRGGRRRGRSRLVPGRPQGPSAFQIHGRVVHAVPGRQTGEEIDLT